MDNKEFGKELEKRTRKFAVKIIHLYNLLLMWIKSKFVVSINIKKAEYINFSHFRHFSSL